jgi:exonuclease SbcC
MAPTGAVAPNSCLNKQATTTLQWASINGGTVVKPNNALPNNIVGMSYAVFQNSAYLRQGRADAFTQLTPSERRDILAQILEIDQYEKYRLRTKTTHSTTKKSTSKDKWQTTEQRVAEIPALEVHLNNADDRLYRQNLRQIC